MRLVVCSECDELKEYHSMGRCQPCHARNYYQTHKQELHEYKKRWWKRNRTRILARNKRRKVAREAERAGKSD